MKDSTLQIKFANKQKPRAAFDLIRLEDLLNRKDIDHSPFEIHRVDFYIIMTIESGNGTHTIDFTDYKYKKGSLITIRRNQLHKFNFSKTAKGSLLLFTDQFLSSYLEELEELKSIQLFNEIIDTPKFDLTSKELKDVNDLIRRINDEYFGDFDQQSLSIIRSELHILISKLFRIKSRRNSSNFTRKYMSEFIAFQTLVEQQIRQKNKVAEYAKMLGCSTKTLNTITRSIIDKSAKEFLDDIYIYFKRHTNLTPEQFRTAES